MNAAYKLMSRVFKADAFPSLENFLRLLPRIGNGRGGWLLGVWLSFSGWVCAAEVQPWSGPLAGGNRVVVTNCATAIGDGADIVRVWVGGADTTELVGQGPDWVAFMVPAAEEAGEKTLVIESVSVGATTLVDAYTVNPAGQIGGLADGPYAWTNLGSGMNKLVNALALDEDGILYAGGAFTNAGGVTATRVAKWDGESWSAMGQGVDSHVYALAVDGAGTVYVGGDFMHADGNAINKIAMWKGQYWESVGGCYGVNEDVNVLALGADGLLYAGGDFSDVCETSMKAVASWNGTYWEGFGAGPNHGVYAVAKDSTGPLYAGGIFTTAGGLTVNRVARWNGSYWDSMGSGMNNYVLAMASDGEGGVYAGGAFTQADGMAISHIAHWNGHAWESLGPGLNGNVHALAVGPDGELYAGGDFYSAGGVPLSYIAQWNGSSWTNLGSGLDGYPNELLVGPEGELYVGGNFTIAGSVSARRVAKWARTKVVVSGVSPASGARSGGYPVTISGSHLGDGADIYRVTLNGAEAAIQSQSATQVVVLAGVGTAGLGAVRVFSTSFGETVKPNAFTYMATDARLTVDSPHGNPAPALGTQAYALNAQVDCQAGSPETWGDTQYVCVGWVVAGSEPAAGSGSSVSLTLAQDAVLTWLWVTNYWLDTEAGPHGSVNVGDGWQPKGGTLTITATADAYCHFTDWTGSEPGEENPLPLLMNEPKLIRANFAENLVPHAATPVPEAWMAQYGLTNFEADLNEDPDGDGQSTWEEFVAMGSDPTDAASYFHAEMEASSSGWLTLSWPSVSGRVYDVEYLVPGSSWQATECVNQPATPPRNTAMDLSAYMTHTAMFFRAVVRKVD